MPRCNHANALMAQSKCRSPVRGHHSCPFKNSNDTCLMCVGLVMSSFSTSATVLVRNCQQHVSNAEMPSTFQASTPLKKCLLMAAIDHEVSRVVLLRQKQLHVGHLRNVHRVQARDTGHAWLYGRHSSIPGKRITTYTEPATLQDDERFFQQILVLP